MRNCCESLMNTFTMYVLFWLQFVRCNNVSFLCWEHVSVCVCIPASLQQFCSNLALDNARQHGIVESAKALQKWVSGSTFACVGLWEMFTRILNLATSLPRAHTASQWFLHPLPDEFWILLADSHSYDKTLPCTGQHVRKTWTPFSILKSLGNHTNSPSLL